MTSEQRNNTKERQENEQQIRWRSLSS